VDLGSLPELALLRFVVRHLWLRDEKICKKSRLLRLRVCKNLVVGWGAGRTYEFVVWLSFGDAEFSLLTCKTFGDVAK
jgi:hypothetical protein